MSPQKMKILRLSHHTVSFVTLAQPVAQELQASIPWHRPEKKGPIQIRAHLSQQEVNSKSRV